MMIENTLLYGRENLHDSRISQSGNLYKMAEKLDAVPGQTCRNSNSRAEELMFRGPSPSARPPGGDPLSTSSEADDFCVFLFFTCNPSFRCFLRRGVFFVVGATAREAHFVLLCIIIATIHLRLPCHQKQRPWHNHQPQPPTPAQAAPPRATSSPSSLPRRPINQQHQ